MATGPIAENTSHRSIGRIVRRVGVVLLVPLLVLAALLFMLFYSSNHGAYSDRFISREKPPWINGLENVGVHVPDAIARRFLIARSAHFVLLTETDCAEVQLPKGITHVSFRNCKLTNGSLISSLQDVDSVEWLVLEGVRISDQAANVIVTQRNLSELFVSDASVGDGFANALCGLRLYELGLSKTSITDDSAKAIGSMTSLWSLDVSGTSVSDAFTRQLANIPRRINLSSTRITDDSLLALRGLKGDGPWGAYLYLANTTITDAGIAHLEGSEITNLDIQDTNVTAGCIRSLDRMPRLERIVISKGILPKKWVEASRSAGIDVEETD